MSPFKPIPNTPLDPCQSVKISPYNTPSVLFITVELPEPEAVSATLVTPKAVPAFLI